MKKSQKLSLASIGPKRSARSHCRTVQWNPGKPPSLVPRPLTHRSRTAHATAPDEESEAE